MKKSIILLLVLILIPIVAGITVEQDVSFQNSSIYYNTSSQIVVNTIEVKADDLVLDGDSFCDSSFTGNFVTNKICAVVSAVETGAETLRNSVADSWATMAASIVTLFMVAVAIFLVAAFMFDFNGFDKLLYTGIALALFLVILTIAALVLSTIL